MAKGNIVRWITIKGRRIPIYEDGSMGGFMEGKAHVTKVGETTGGIFNIKEMNEKITKEKADKEAADKKLSEKANKTFKSADKDIKRAAQAQILEDMGIDRDAALEMIQEKAKVSSERAEEMMDNMDVKKIKELAESKQNVKSRIAEGSKSLEDHSDIQRIAEEHVKKIWNGGAANRELYDAADKWAEEHNFDKTKAKDAAFAAMNKKQMAEIAKRENAKGFSAEAAAKDINAISMNHNNRGGDTENDWKKVRDTLEAAPAGTVMIQTGDRGAKYQFTKGEDGQWHGSWDSDSKTLSMGWVGQGHRPEVEFTTPDKALSKEQIKDTQTAAVNGKLNQQLGLDKNGRKIGNRSTPKVDVPEKSIKIGDKQVGVSKDPHAAEKIASAKKMVANNESNLAGLREQLKKHPNDEHTAEIKAAIKKAEGRVKDSKNTLAEREGKKVSSASVESKLRESLRRYNRPDADKEAYNMVEAYKKGQIEPEQLKMWGITDEELKSLSQAGRKEAQSDIDSGRAKKTVIDPLGNLRKVNKKTAYEKNYGEDLPRKGKSIKVGNKEVKVKKDKSMDDIFENRTTTRGTTPGMINTMSSTALRTQLRKAGVSSADMKGKDTEELRRMLLAIYKKK